MPSRGSHASLSRTIRTQTHTNREDEGTTRLLNDKESSSLPCSVIALHSAENKELAAQEYDVDFQEYKLIKEHSTQSSSPLTMQHNSSINGDTTTSFSNTHAVQANFNPVKISLTYPGASPLLSPRTTLNALRSLWPIIQNYFHILTSLQRCANISPSSPIVGFSMHQQLQRHTIIRSTLGTNPQTHPRKRNNEMRN